MQSSQAEMFALSIILQMITSLMIVFRFRVRRRTRIGSDDWTILVTLALSWGVAELIIVGAASHVFGSHISVDAAGQEIATPGVTDSTIPLAVKLLYALYLAMILGLFFMKLSVILLYRRVFVSTSTRYRIGSYIVFILITVWCIGFFLATVFQCGGQPANFWTSPETSQYLCVNTSILQLVLGVLDVVTDLLILMMPVPLVWVLAAHQKSQRLAIIATFVPGLLCVAGSVMRLAIVTISLVVTIENSRDILGEINDVVLWSFVEMEIAIIGSCLPVLRPLIMNPPQQSSTDSVQSEVLPTPQMSQPTQIHDEERPTGESISELPANHFMNNEMSGPHTQRPTA